MEADGLGARRIAAAGSPRLTRLSFGVAVPSDAGALTKLHNEAADELEGVYGPGYWTSGTLEKNIARAIDAAHVLVARDGVRIVGTLALQTKKPWAIDVSYFTDATPALYLVSMAVAPSHQRTGAGRQLLEYATTVAAGRGARSIRLDAWDAPAGAGGFYAACGYREVARVEYKGTPLIYYEQLPSEDALKNADAVQILIDRYPAPAASLASALRTWVRTTYPQFEETADASANIIGYGVAPGYKGLVCTIILSKSGVKLGISNGATLDDPSALLEGTGKKHRYVEIRDAAELRNPALKKLVDAALVRVHASP